MTLPYFAQRSIMNVAHTLLASTRRTPSGSLRSPVLGGTSGTPTLAASCSISRCIRCLSRRCRRGCSKGTLPPSKMVSATKARTSAKVRRRGSSCGRPAEEGAQQPGLSTLDFRRQSNAAMDCALG
eukprot:scaffold123287_cov30-Tisochrysis_lutea.AAC.4